MDGKYGVVSMPCAKLFDEQSIEYRRKVLPFKVPIIAVEAAAAQGWYKYAHHAITMKTFGCSGKGAVSVSIRSISFSWRMSPDLWE